MKKKVLPDSGKITEYVEGVFSCFGVNKRREITRLVFEIAKRDGVSFRGIVKGLEGEDFSFVKKSLLARRYPSAFSHMDEGQAYLPKIDIDPGARAKIGKFRFYPKDIYIERDVGEAVLTKRMQSCFPKARCHSIDSLQEYMRRETSRVSFRNDPAGGYNRRTDNLFLTRERHDFLKDCPCTSGALCCGYLVLNIGFGCAYECTYCFLQEYQNIPGIIIPAELDDFFAGFQPRRRKGIFNFIRIGTGEFTDSLIFDRMTGFSGEIMKFFNRYPRIVFEFKTKSDSVETFLARDPQRNIVVSWSMNPQGVIDGNEFYSANLSERLAAASACARAGWRVGFHFDPVIHYRGWFNDYRRVVERIFDSVPEKAIAWISLGTLRFSPGLKKIIENRFPDNTILDEELILGFDRKMRYAETLRIAIYRALLGEIRRRSKTVFLYLCMEERKIWRTLAPLLGGRSNGPV